MSSNIIFSKVKNEYIPITIKKKSFRLGGVISPYCEYYLYDKRKMVGVVQLLDKDYGCNVQYVENCKPKEYKHVGYLADKLEVQHCLERGLDIFEIRSQAANNSHALHYLRGKRFEGIATPEQICNLKKIFGTVNLKSFKYDNVVKYIIDHTPEGLLYYTKFLEQIPMYMPQCLIQKYVRELTKHPLIIK